jgi:uncharacterized protein YciI
MTLFAVTRRAGPDWVEGKGAFDQPCVNEHAAFMSTLATEGLVLFAGPLNGTEQGHIRVLLIAAAENEAGIRHRLADDPWEKTRRIATVNVEPWNLLVGADRLPACHQ